MHTWIAGAVLAVLVAAAAAVPGAPPATAARPSVTQLGWLTGCLELRSADRVVEEYRMPVRAGSMLGMARTTSSMGLFEYELTLIREKGGKVIFEAHPSGQPAATFTATLAGPDSVIFGAPEHEYPQVVGYRRVGADSVVAWIDGTVGGKSRRVEFPYRRVTCPAASR